MMNETRVVESTRAQAETIIRRLKTELSDEDGGFYHDRDVIRKAANNAEMKCLCRGRKIIGFCVFTLHSNRSKIDILEIFPAYRDKGYGKFLAHHVVQILFSAGSPSIEVECAPSTSEPFWRKIGFEDHEDPVTDFGRRRLALNTRSNVPTKAMT